MLFAGFWPKIAFVFNRDGNDEIYVMDSGGGAPTRLTNNQAPDGYPAWSPDGQKIVFSSGRDLNDEIYVMNADGSAQTRFTDDWKADADPTWSADGARLPLLPTAILIWKSMSSTPWEMAATRPASAMTRRMTILPIGQLNRKKPVQAL
jgi:Tol biopolymer transport system component